MICNSPSPTVLCSLRQARIVMPSLVVEFIGTIRQSAPYQRGDRVDHYSEFIFGDLHFVGGFARFGKLLQGYRRSSARPASCDEDFEALMASPWGTWNFPPRECRFQTR